MVQEFEKEFGQQESRSTIGIQPSSGEQVREEAEALWDEALHEGRKFLAGRKDGLAEQAGMLSEALRRAAIELDRPEAELMRHYLERSAQSLDRTAQSLRQRDVEEILQRVQTFGREQPTALLGGAIVVGMLLGRLLHSSSPSERPEESARFGSSQATASTLGQPATGETAGAFRTSEEEGDVSKH